MGEREGDRDVEIRTDRQMGGDILKSTGVKYIRIDRRHCAHMIREELFFSALQ